MAALMLAVGLSADGGLATAAWLLGWGVLLAGAVVTLLVRPYQLKLSAPGFRYVTILGRTRNYAWHDCGLFRVARWPDGYRRVSPQGVFFRTIRRDELGRPRDSLLSRLIGATYRGIEPSEIVKLMNDYRELAIRQAR
jgi:hypothetical protein